MAFPPAFLLVLHSVVLILALGVASEDRAIIAEAVEVVEAVEVEDATVVAPVPLAAVYTKFHF